MGGHDPEHPNQLPGTVTEVHAGEARATVAVRLDGGPRLLAVITPEAAEQLRLGPRQPRARPGEGHGGVPRHP
ncbi:TOBE domain-containing protein [Streptomyces sp. NPDC049590]|uniref:TOBE domain-containing protein n=1 Tax=Streptomyces sp. NPDC049590 TaxID=3154834 RepID=UPI0034193C4A